MAEWHQRRLESRNILRYESWIRKLQENPPDVFIGPDLTYGGVRGHIRSIEKYSALNIQLVPDEKTMAGLENFTAEIRERFMKFDPSGSPVVHSHVLPWMIQWCRRQQQRGLRWIHTYHLPYFAEHGRERLELWQKEINEALIHEACHADVRLSVSRWQQDYLRSEYGIETDYLPNGVDVRVCDHGRANRFRSRHSIKNPFILYVGRNTPVKNPADFVRLAQSLPSQNFVMLGQQLSAENIRRDWGLESPPNLNVLGAATHSEVQDALAACAALVVTSKREGLPTLVLESMTHAKPIIVPNEAGCMEAIGDEEFGLIYRQGDIHDLAGKTVSALEDRRQWANSRQRILDEYDWRVVAKKLDQIYRS